ncbi:hypothetical protein GGI12_004499 [Dipsacomyces acuminosporus]|nr:hypothetical protein GGI12_004499 [Dipsacomyces acuminosporus]
MKLNPLDLRTLLLCLFYTVQSSALSPPDIYKRDLQFTDFIKSSVGGVIYRNGYQTTCEFLPIDNRAAFAAASCFDVDGGGRVDTKKTSYVLAYDNNNTEKLVNYPVEKVTIHPDYDPKTLANNIAIVHSNLQAGYSWSVGIAMDPSSWDSYSYVKRKVKNKKNKGNLWYDNPKVGTASSGEGRCSNSSALYKDNLKDFACTSELTESAYSKTCLIPYGSIYVNYNGAPIAAGIYSHTVSYDSDTCSTKNQISYYTLLSDYVAFAAKTTGREVVKIKKDSNYSPNDDSSFKMNATSPAIQDVTVYSGDIYARRGDVREQTDFDKLPKSNDNTAPEESADASPSSSLAASATNSAAATNGANASSSPSSTSSVGIGRTETIIIAVVVPIGSLVLVVALFFAYKRYKHRRRSVTGRVDQADFPILDSGANYRGDGNMRITSMSSALPAYEEIDFGEEQHARPPVKAHT